MLKIGFDAKRFFNNSTGLGNYSRTLIENLIKYFPNNEYHLYTTKVEERYNSIHFLGESNTFIHTAKGLSKAFWRTFSIKKDLKESNVSIYHGLSHEIPRGMKKSGIKTIVTIHDLIFKVYPELYPRIDSKIYDSKFFHACKHSDKIIAISESTKKDIIKYYKIPADKITVVYQTCDEQFMKLNSDDYNIKVLEKYSLPKDYLLYVGSIIERKNLLSVVKALKQLPNEIKIPLVVIGKGKKYKDKIVKYIAENNMQNDVIFCEGVDFKDFPAIYQKAKVFLYPSIYEGFGIPIIEALYSKTPVITTRESCLPEAGGEHSYYVNPEKPEEIVEGIEKILTNKEFAEQMINESYKFVQKFDAKILTAQVFELYQNTIKE